MFQIQYRGGDVFDIILSNANAYTNVLVRCCEALKRLFPCISGPASVVAITLAYWLLQISVSHLQYRFQIPIILIQIQSIKTFFSVPTIANPSALWPRVSCARIMTLAGNIGLSGLTWAASFAACSIASISSLQPAWSKGHTTIGWRRRISLAAESWAYTDTLTFIMAQSI
jgi:hypothetical protein